MSEFGTLVTAALHPVTKVLMGKIRYLWPKLCYCLQYLVCSDSPKSQRRIHALELKRCYGDCSVLYCPSNMNLKHVLQAEQGGRNTHVSALALYFITSCVSTFYPWSRWRLTHTDITTLALYFCHLASTYVLLFYGITSRKSSHPACIYFILLVK